MSISEFVTLQDGPTLPLEVLKLAWSLEDQGFHFEAMEGTLRLCRSDGNPPAPLLADEDRAGIIRWKTHLLSLLEYSATRNRVCRGPISRSA